MSSLFSASPRTLTVAVILIGIASAGAFYWTREPAPAPEPGGSADAPTVALEVPPLPPDGYAGTDSCTECHRDIATEWQTHPMSRSAGLIETLAVVEDYTERNVLKAGPDLRYHIDRNSAGATHREVFVDGDGDVLYEDAVSVRLAIGSGQRGRSYVLHRGDGLLFMSPVSWYSSRQEWGLSPGYENIQNLRFSRRIVHGCVQCHTGRAVPLGANTDRFAEPLFTEFAIGCERCHGPGNDHITHHRDPESRAVTDTIVNPVRLDFSRRDSVCFQCHLQGVERVLRFGRTEFDFRPGDHLNDIWTAFVDGDRIDEAGGTRAVSQVEQMRSSVCWTASGGELGCISCHDPHNHTKPANRVEWYRNRCQQCHTDQTTNCAVPIEERDASEAGNSCVDCHMPRLSASDVPHTSQTDHRIVRNSESPRPEKPDFPLGYLVFDAEAVAVPELEIRRAKTLLAARLAQRGDDPILAAEVIPELEQLCAQVDDVVMLEALGSLQRNIEQYDLAIATYRKALLVDPEHEPTLWGLVLASDRWGQPADVLEYVDRYIKVNPWDPRAHGRRAHVLARMGRMPEAIEAATRGLAIDPASSVTHGWLSQAYETLGESQKSVYHRRLFEALDGD